MDPEVRHGVQLLVCYDGAAFHGFAPQKTVRTVHGALTEAIRAIDPTIVDVRGTSRTDSGVHAEGQSVAFHSALQIPAKGWVLGLNAKLPDDVSVRAARAIGPEFNPRFENLGKRYVYRVLLDAVRDPLRDRRAWRIGEPVDRNLLISEANALIGTFDFAAFRGKDERENTVRTILGIDVTEEDQGRVLAIRVTGTAFLFNMVRIVVGTLVDVARGRKAPGAAARALASLDRRDAGMTAPPHGLCLEEVFWKPLETGMIAGPSWPEGHFEPAVSRDATPSEVAP